MTKYRIIWVGRQAQDPLLRAVENYLSRLQHYARTELQCLREGTKITEAKAILEAIDRQSYVIALDERGELLTTMQLATHVRAWQDQGQREVVFVIGGADGLHEDVTKRAQRLMSLSRFTLPHRLAQVVLVEQLYRAHTILRGEPYHRA